MRFLWWNITRHEKPKKTTAIEVLEDSVDYINEAWEEVRKTGDKVRPWVIWEDNAVVLSRWEGKAQIVYGSKSR